MVLRFSVMSQKRHILFVCCGLADACLHGRYKFLIKSLEIFVLENSLCRYTMDWIVSQHLIQQVVASAVDDFHLFAQLFLCPTWKRWLVIGQRCYAGPNVFGWRFKNSRNVNDIKIKPSDFMLLHHIFT